MLELAQRSTAGFIVTLLYDSGEVFVRGETEQYAATSAVIAPERAREAFDHPCLFIPGAERFFDRRHDLTNEEDADELETFEEYGGETGADFQGTA